MVSLINSFLKKDILVLNNLSQKIEKEGIFSNSFYEARSIQILKPENNITMK